MTIERFSNLSEEEQYSLLNGWANRWKTQLVSCPEKMTRHDVTYIDLMSYAYRFYRRESTLKPRAAALVEGWLLKFPYLASLDLGGLGMVRHVDGELTYKPANDLQLPWLDWFALEHLKKAAGIQELSLARRLNYRVPLPEGDWSYRHDLNLPVTNDDHILYLCTLSESELRELIPQA